MGKWQANRKPGATNQLVGCPTRCSVDEEYDLAKVTTYPFPLVCCVTFSCYWGRDDISYAVFVFSKKVSRPTYIFLLSEGFDIAIKSKIS